MKRISRPDNLVIIRHAESMRNKAKGHTTYFADENARMGVQGIPDHLIPLSEDGMEKARLSGGPFRARYGVPDYIYHSGYLRTVQTMEGFLEAYTSEERARIKIRSNPFIRERDPGFTYDMTEAEAEKNFPWLKNHWNTFGGFFSRPPGGESLADVSDRVYLFLNMLFRDRAGKRIFAFSHGGTIRCFRYKLERWTYERALKWPPGQSPKNCGVTSYRFSPAENRLVLECYNEILWK
jgi:2,3-bisphosphoglycerate-dependent phosphoglycerate mutase